MSRVLPIADGFAAAPVEGFTLRDHFAAAALQGLLASAGRTNVTFESYAKCAYHHADAMLKERAK